MVRWYHAIFTAYGFWLPNDPRGSWSDFVAGWELFYAAGGATKTTARRSVAGAEHDRTARREAKQSLKYPEVEFDAEQRKCVADGYGQACEEASFAIRACAIGRGHAHIVVDRHARTIEQIVQHLKSRATKHLNAAGRHPLGDFANVDGSLPTPWAEGCWHVFINDEQQLEAAIDYVNDNPAKEGLPRQHFPFVIPV